jgi:tight adherence protein B
LTVLTLTILSTLGLVVAVLLVFVGIGRSIERQETVASRLESLIPDARTVPVVDEDRKARWFDPILETLGRFVSGRSFAASMATDLARANIPLTVPEYVLLHLAASVALLILVFFLTRQLLFALLGAVLGLFLPRIYVRRREAKRMLLFQDQLPDVLTLLVGSLRSGYGITIAMDTVAKQMPPPVSEEFARVVREVGLGMSSTQALQNLVRRIRSDDLDLMVTAIAIQYEVGGNLATILETISGTIRERIRLKGQLRVLTAQQSLQRIILTILPVAVAAVVYVIRPEYILALFTPGPTLLIPIVAVVLEVAGYFVMGKLGKVEF